MVEERHLQSLWPLLLPLLFLLPGLFLFPYPSADAPYSDLVISHYPNALFLRRALLEWRSVPLWSSTILSGYPFAADPLSGLWYPPGWLALLLPLPFGFNLLVALHLLWGGVGMYRLLRMEGLTHPAALFGGLAFEAMPKLFAHYGAGHLTLLYAISWTPWLLASSLPVALSPPRPLAASPSLPVAPSPSLPRFLQSGVVLALVFLADPRWAAYAGLLWWSYVLAHSQFSPCPPAPLLPCPPAPLPPSSRAPSLPRSLAFLLSQTLLAALLAAPLALPLLEYTRLSTRAHLTSQEVLTFSLPFPRLLGLIFPDFGGFQEWILYPGGIVLVLGLVAVFQNKIRVHPRSPAPDKGFWLLTLLLTLIFSLGSQIPLLPLLARLPGFDLLRVPSRALFLSGIALAALAAWGLNHLLQEGAVGRRSLRLSLLALVAFTLAMAAAVWMVNRNLPLNFAWGAGMVLAASLWVAARLRGRLSSPVGPVILFGLALLDWGAVNLSGYAPRPEAIVFSESEAVAKYLAAQPVPFRVYSPSYSLPQQTAARYGLQLADGVDPLQLEAYAAFMERATGVPRGGYSVTLPPFVGDPEDANAAYLPDARLLGLLDVRFVVAEYDLPAEGLTLRETFGNTRLYENTVVLPRAWIEAGGARTTAEIVLWTSNRVVLRAAGPGLLVLSEIAYPGWRVRVDGETAEMQVAEGLLRAVLLPPGEHEVAFTFQPISVYIGFFLFVGGVVLTGLKKLTAENAESAEFLC